MIIKIPFKTPSVNHLYFNFHNRRILTKEARELKKEIGEIVLKDISFIVPTLNFGLKVSVEIHENWFCKDKSVKRVDISNREKFLIDSVFEALGIDDKFIFEHTMKKVQDSEEYALITISYCSENASASHKQKRE